MNELADIVEAIFAECLVSEGGVKVEGITTSVRFDLRSLKSNEDALVDVIESMDQRFTKSEESGQSGFSFLMLPFLGEAESREKWCEHATAERFLLMAMALGKAKYTTPRENWSSQPGGVPYILLRAEGKFSDESKNDSSGGL